MRIFMHFLDFDASEQTAGGKGAPRGAPATLDRFFLRPISLVSTGGRLEEPGESLQCLA
jgi:hypothetical protein